jgi:hypothetical protein
MLLRLDPVGKFRLSPGLARALVHSRLRHVRDSNMDDMVCGNELQTVRSDVLKKKQS